MAADRGGKAVAAHGGKVVGVVASHHRILTLLFARAETLGAG